MKLLVTRYSTDAHGGTKTRDRAQSSAFQFLSGALLSRLADQGEARPLHSDSASHSPARDRWTSRCTHHPARRRTRGGPGTTATPADAEAAASICTSSIRRASSRSSETPGTPPAAAPSTSAIQAAARSSRQIFQVTQATKPRLRHVGLEAFVPARTPRRRRRRSRWTTQPRSRTKAAGAPPCAVPDSPAGRSSPASASQQPRTVDALTAAPRNYLAARCRVPPPRPSSGAGQLDLVAARIGAGTALANQPVRPRTGPAPR